VRSVLLATAALAAALAAASAAQALPTQLRADTVASVSGGCNGCGHADDQQSFTLSTLTSDVQDKGGGGSVGHAHVISQYGTQKVSADAFLASGDPGPDVQTRASSEYDENFPAGAFPTGFYHLNFDITGTLSAQPDIGPGSVAVLNWDFEDVTHPASLSFGTFLPGAGFTPLHMTIPVPVDDVTTLRVRFEADAYTADPGGPTRFADFSHTLHTYIDPVGGGPDVIGESGHDYATPLAGGVPEPASWALMLLGFGGLGAALRRRLAAA
jgi:hypothetical protein